MDCKRVERGTLVGFDAPRTGVGGLWRGDEVGGGAMQLLTGLLDHALAGHLAGKVSHIDVELDDEQFCVRDDGPGMSVGDLFGGAGIALSQVGRRARRVELEISRFGARRRWLFEDLELLVEGERIGAGATGGTCVRVWPDPRALADDGLDPLAVEQRLLGLHLVRPSLHVTLNGQRFDAPRGTDVWVAAQRCCRGAQVHHIEARRGTTEIDLAWAWLPPLGSARRTSFVNLEETIDDGSHVDGLLAGLARAHGVSLALARERALAMVNVMIVNPRFSAASRRRLHDPMLERWVAELVEQHLARSRDPITRS